MNTCVAAGSPETFSKSGWLLMRAIIGSIANLLIAGGSFSAAVMVGTKGSICVMIAFNQDGIAGPGAGIDHGPGCIL